MRAKCGRYPFRSFVQVALFALVAAVALAHGTGTPAANTNNQPKMNAMTEKATTASHTVRNTFITAGVSYRYFSRWR